MALSLSQFAAKILKLYTTAFNQSKHKLACSPENWNVHMYIHVPVFAQGTGEENSLHGYHREHAQPVPGPLGQPPLRRHQNAAGDGE